ncbi:unnamed protein product [Leptidea sinapis]|uniref:FP protein C-terminal domain-containing protein n=1 Tax=Leptidea sinapis TaxID=189913 RepID=A0A5E4QRC9_9NEOP|nr:unnamed protein product [Leptidea sinapis]
MRITAAQSKEKQNHKISVRHIQIREKPNASLISQFNARFSKIESIREEYLNLTEKINSLKLLLNPKDTIDMQAMSAFDDLYYEVLGFASAVRPEPSKTSATGACHHASTSDTDKVIHAKLPRTELPKFDRSALGIAKQVKVTWDSYELVFNELVKRYQNKRILAVADELQERLSSMEQFARLSNVDIVGIPEHRNEDTNKIIKEICNVVGFSLPSPQDIIFTTRVGKINRESKRPRNLVCQFSNKLVLYVNEHLTPANKSLHAETRKLAKTNGYKFVWVRSGKIFVRIEDTSPAKNILSSEHLPIIELIYYSI